MEMIKHLINIVFSAALFINAVLFIPQVVTIVKQRSIAGVSLLMFTGFFLIQLVIVLHGLIQHDYILVTGFLLSMLTCGCVILAIVYFKFINKATMVPES